MTLALLFPGQGAQHVGMGASLAAASEAARRTLEEADDVLGFGLSTLMAEGPEERLTETRHGQLAILTHSVAVLRAVRDRLGPVAWSAGHSLGEYSAHVAAGTLSFADALETVRVRADLMFEAGQARPGTMAAVLGLPDDQVVAACEGGDDEGVCVAANFNADGQVVISGDVDAVARAGERAKEAGARRVIPLNVSGAFHSPLMEPAATGLAGKLAAVELRDPEWPVCANVTAAAVTTGDEARRLLEEQVTAPVRWADSMRTMVDGGVDRFVELGPGSVLCGLAKRLARGVPCVSVGEADHLDRLG